MATTDCGIDAAGHGLRLDACGNCLVELVELVVAETSLAPWAKGQARLTRSKNPPTPLRNTEMDGLEMEMAEHDCIT